MKFLNMDKIKEMPEKYANGWCLGNGEKTGVIHAKYGLMDLENDRQEMSWDDALEEICEDASKNHFLDVYERKQTIRLLKPYIAKGRRNLICDFGASSGHMIADLERRFPRNRFIACDLCGGGVIPVLSVQAWHHAYSDEFKEYTVSGSGDRRSSMPECTGAYRG